MSDNLKKLEELTLKLETKENQMKAFFELSIDPMVIANETHFELVNGAWTRELGWSEAEMLSRPWRAFVKQDDAVVTEAEHRKLVVGKDVMHFRNHYLCKDGSYKTLEWNAKVTPSGKYYCVARIVSDGQ